MDRFFDSTCIFSKVRHTWLAILATVEPVYTFYLPLECVVCPHKRFSLELSATARWRLAYECAAQIQMPHVSTLKLKN